MPYFFPICARTGKYFLILSKLITRTVEEQPSMMSSANDSLLRALGFVITEVNDTTYTYIHPSNGFAVGVYFTESKRRGKYADVSYFHNSGTYSHSETMKVDFTPDDLTTFLDRFGLDATRTVRLRKLRALIGE